MKYIKRLFERIRNRLKWKRAYPVRDPIKDYFPLPKEIFTLGLTPGEIAVYSYLMYIENRETYDCWAKLATIGRAIGVSSRNTVAKYIQGLVEKELIATEHTLVTSNTGRTQNGCLMFHIRPIEEAIRYHHDTEVEKLAQIAMEEKLRKALKEFEKRNKTAEKATGTK